jgi:hypothetical protein
MWYKVQRTENGILALLMTYGNASRNIALTRSIQQKTEVLSNSFITKCVEMSKTQGPEKNILKPGQVNAILKTD